MGSNLLNLEAIDILLQMSNVLVTALSDGTPVVVDEILVEAVGLFKKIGRASCRERV